MSNIAYTIQFHTYWHCGTGLSAGAESDEVAIKDASGLPYVPGRTIKGLLRDAAEEIAGVTGTGFEAVDKLFGEEGKKKSEVFFSNAELTESEHRYISSNGLSEYMYKTVSSTEIGVDGTASKMALRSIQVCVPCILHGIVINVPEDQETINLLLKSMKFIKCLGMERNRGLGRCTVSVKKSEYDIIEEKDETEQDSNIQNNAENSTGKIKRLFFKCKLLSDVILNRKIASTEKNETLDFIPGNNFLGIVASGYPSMSPAESLLIFHSGRVRFGDAHPVVKKNESGIYSRCLRVPAMFYKAKTSDDDKRYINWKAAEAGIYNIIQPVQCRDEFYDYSDSKAVIVGTPKIYSIKSAYDKADRRAKDEQIFGYQALCKGLELIFNVEIEDESIQDKITSLLCGTRHIGRSRTAQYGVVQIEQISENRVLSCQSRNSCDTDDIAYIYAEGRLIFLDENGLPTFRPTAEQLGLPLGSMVDWHRSEIRTFQYAPWNHQRQSFDADRCGIEKGSVFVAAIPEREKLKIRGEYVGSYNNEGFGKVIYNPSFLDSDSEGIVKVKFPKEADSGNNEEETMVHSRFESTLISYLETEAGYYEALTVIYRKVEEWKDKNGKIFSGCGISSSQWGQVRKIASSSDEDNVKNAISTFINKGRKKWDSLLQRRMMEFIDDAPVGYKVHSIINLSSEMGKYKIDKVEK